jgi:hypothetical protein
MLYRLYKLTDGHVTEPPINITAGSDDAALEEAKKKRLAGQDFELWQGERLVSRLNASDVAHQKRG